MLNVMWASSLLPSFSDIHNGAQGLLPALYFRDHFWQGSEPFGVPRIELGLIVCKATALLIELSVLHVCLLFLPRTLFLWLLCFNF